MQKHVSLAMSSLYLSKRDRWTKKYIPIIKYICTTLWLNFYKGPAGLEKNILNFVNKVLLFHYYHILKKEGDTSFRESGNPLPDVPTVVKIGSVIIEKHFFSTYLCTCVIILCLKSSKLF